MLLLRLSPLQHQTLRGKKGTRIVHLFYLTTHSFPFLLPPSTEPAYVNLPRIWKKNTAMPALDV